MPRAYAVGQGSRRRSAWQRSDPISRRSAPHSRCRAGALATALPGVSRPGATRAPGARGRGVAADGAALDGGLAPTPSSGSATGGRGRSPRSHGLPHCLTAGNGAGAACDVARLSIQVNQRTAPGNTIRSRAGTASAVAGVAEVVGLTHGTRRGGNAAGAGAAYEAALPLIAVLANSGDTGDPACRARHRIHSGVGARGRGGGRGAPSSGPTTPRVPGRTGTRWRADARHRPGAARRQVGRPAAGLRACPAAPPSF